MCVLTVQSDVGYATHVSTKPLPIWSSSRKDWSDWSMEPAYEHANQTRDVSQDKLSRGTNPTAMGIDDWLGAASRDERTSDRCAHARWMHVIPSHAHATIACARQKHRHPRANVIDDLAMDDVEALRIRHESTYHNLARAGRARARAARVREINASFLFTFKTSHGQSRRRGARAIDRSIDRAIDRTRACERGRFSTTSRVTDTLASRDVVHVEIDSETNHTKYIHVIRPILGRRRRAHARTSAASRMYVSSAHSITVLPSGPSRVTEYLALIAERGAAVRRATVDVRAAENAEAVTAVEEIVKADIVCAWYTCVRL